MNTTKILTACICLVLTCTACGGESSLKATIAAQETQIAALRGLTGMEGAVEVTIPVDTTPIPTLETDIEVEKVIPFDATPIPIPSSEPTPTSDVDPFLPTAAPICEAAFQKPVNAGTPTGPVFLLLNRDYEHVGWTRVIDSCYGEPISFPFIEAHYASDVQSLVCIQESRMKVGGYTDGDPAYQTEWNVRLVSWPSGEAIEATTLAGRQPPGGKGYGSGPAYGTSPREELLRWILSALGETTVLVHRGVSGVAFSPDGTTLVSSSSDAPVVTGEENSVKLWDVVTGRLIFTLDEGDGVRGVIFSPDGKTIAFPLDHDIVRIVDIATKLEIHTFSKTVRGDHAVAFSPDGETIAMGEWSGQVELWDVKTGQLIRTLRGSTEGIDILAFSADGSILAALGNMGTPKLWETTTGEPIAQSIVRSTYGYNSLAFSPDGKTLALSGEDDDLNAVVSLFDVTSEEVMQTLVAPSPRILHIAFSPNGRILASSSYENEVILWDLETGQVFRTLTGHTNRVIKLTFSPDGRLLASASLDHTIKLWNIASGQ